MRLVIFGAGGMGRETLRIAQQSYSEIVFADDVPLPPILGVPVLKPSAVRDDDALLVAIGDSATRRRIIERFPTVKLASIFAVTSIVGHNTVIGSGALLREYAIVTACTQIGSNFQCNMYSCIAHDCLIGDDVTFAPKVCCNGNVHIGDGVYVGAGAIIRNGTEERPLVVGEGAIIGMGAVVTQDVPPGARVIGNPARTL